MQIIKGTLVLLISAVMLSSCSNEGSEDAVTTQNVESPKAANDYVAKPVAPADSGENMNQGENPFAGDHQHAEVSSPANTADESADVDDPYVEDEENDGGISFRESQDSYLEWDAPTEISYTSAELTIIGPDGKRMQHSFVPGEAIVVQESLPDGHYLWESVITPEIDPYVREEMRAVRESGDFAAEQELVERLRSEGSIPTEAEAQNNRKTGSFSVRNGVATPIPPSYVDQESMQDG